MTRGGARSGAGRPKGLSQYGEATKPIRIPVSMLSTVKEFLQQKTQLLPLYSSKVRAGFPSPADDHLEKHLDLNEHLIKHPAATFFVRVAGTSMVDAGIFENDILIVDRSIEPKHGRIVIAAVDGQLTVKRLHKKSDGRVFLVAENSQYQPIELLPENEVHIWGVVIYVIHQVG